MNENDGVFRDRDIKVSPCIYEMDKKCIGSAYWEAPLGAAGPNRAATCAGALNSAYRAQLSDYRTGY